VTDKHTQGPWYWSDEYQTTSGTETMSLIGNGGFGILSCDGIANSPQYVNSHDAHLIAAAPELLAALEDVLREFVDANQPLSQFDSAIVRKAVEHAQRAIAKARGDA